MLYSDCQAPLNIWKFEVFLKKARGAGTLPRPPGRLAPPFRPISEAVRAIEAGRAGAAHPLDSLPAFGFLPGGNG